MEESVILPSWVFDGASRPTQNTQHIKIFLECFVTGFFF